MTAIPDSLTIGFAAYLERDFGIIIPALKAAGWSFERLAYLVCPVDPVSPRTISRWAKRKQIPPYDKAIVLIAMFDRYCVPCETSDKSGGGSSAGTEVAA